MGRVQPFIELGRKAFNVADDVTKPPDDGDHFSSLDEIVAPKQDDEDDDTPFFRF